MFFSTLIPVLRRQTVQSPTLNVSPLSSQSSSSAVGKKSAADILASFRKKIDRQIAGSLQWAPAV